MEEQLRLQQVQVRIGYTFSDPALLEEALRHSSYVHEAQLPYTACNERLEFLGDAVLELVTSRLLFLSEPVLPEGDLTQRRAGLVCEPNLARLARELELGQALQLGKGEEKTGGREKDSLLCDVMEAVIGAVYLDGGLEAAETLIRMSLFSLEGDTERIFDHKTQLQEVTQEIDHTTPEYHTGPAADGQGFVSEVRIHGTVYGTGRGNAKKAAEQEAARVALQRLRPHND